MTATNCGSHVHDLRHDDSHSVLAGLLGGQERTTQDDVQVREGEQGQQGVRSRGDLAQHGRMPGDPAPELPTDQQPAQHCPHSAARRQAEHARGQCRHRDERSDRDQCLGHPHCQVDRCEPAVGLVTLRYPQRTAHQRQREERDREE